MEDPDVPDLVLFYEPTDSPIMFAQTREDPMVEINALAEISKTNNNLTVCLIASAGDTPSSILCTEVSKNISQIDAIDMNENQLRLAELKCAITKKYPLSKYFILEGTKMDYHSMINGLVEEGLLLPDSVEYWIKNSINLHMLESGINQAGRFETLFHRVMLDMDFKKWFDHDYLTKVFGENATKYSMNKSFSDHFSEVFETYCQTYGSSDENYFYHQFRLNRYNRNADLPIYLKDKIVNENMPIIFIKNSMLSHLESSKNENYDLISLSNITDWLSPNVLTHLMDEVGRVLKPNGKCVMRRLNSDVILEKYLNEIYSKKGKYQFSVEANIFDKSHFYSEVIIVTKHGSIAEELKLKIIKISLPEIEV